MKNTALIVSQAGEIVQAHEIEPLLEPFVASLYERVASHELSQNTAETYKRGAEKFVAWADSQATAGTVTDAARAWKSELLADQYKPATVNAWLSGVKALGAWACEVGQLSYNPALTIKGAKRHGTAKRHARESLTDAEARRVLAQPDTSTDSGVRDAAILYLMLYTALRGVSLYRADLADLKTEFGRLVLMYQGKGHEEKEDAAIIPAAAEGALRDYLAVRGSEPGPLFMSLSDRSRGGRLTLSSYRRIVKEYFRAAGVHGNKTTHSLRHTAITKAIRSGVPLVKVMSMAGHASSDTTLIYFHETDRLTDPAEDHIDYSE